MLTSVEVKNYQSLADVTVKTDWFTVITGPTGAGKSGFFRALGLLTGNARGTSYITSGASTCSVTAGDGRMVARITRSSARGGTNSYQLARRVPVPVGGYGWSGSKYTKLGGQVPPQVSEALGLSELNFSSQWDPPFLLSLPGTQLAQRLGELTNVSLVLGAAAAANRARKQLQRQLDEAAGRHAALEEEARRYAGLGDRRRAVTEAEEALGRYQAAAARLERLRAVTGRLEAAQRVSEAAAAEAARQAPPSLAKLDALLTRLIRLRQLSQAVIDAGREVTLADSEVTRAAAAEVTAGAELHAALAAAGTCPVCGSTIA